MTNDLANLSVQSDYQAGDQVVVGNGMGPPITHTSSSSLKAPSHSFSLKNILHVPKMATISFPLINSVEIIIFLFLLLILILLLRTIKRVGTFDKG